MMKDATDTTKSADFGFSPLDLFDLGLEDLIGRPYSGTAVYKASVLVTLRNLEILRNAVPDNYTKYRLRVCIDYLSQALLPDIF